MSQIELSILVGVCLKVIQSIDNFQEVITQTNPVQEETNNFLDEISYHLQLAREYILDFGWELPKLLSMDLTDLSLGKLFDLHIKSLEELSK